VVTQPGRIVGLAQGLYYLASGIWPLVSIRTFERVTGPKVDDWLVRTVGVLAATIGGVLTFRSLRGRGEPDPLLGAGAALAFAAVDANYAGRGRISKVYLLDAVAEAALGLGWLVAARRGR
jgi:hypothetical protein